LEAKKTNRKDCAGKPLTLGYYDRSDLPFYYALADAFTICDQNFCSSLTGTTPNRLFLWTGTIREQQNAASVANVRNSDVDYTALAKWTTFPERLEDAGISWKIYQNELSLPTGFNGEQDAWLANFTDNPIEWFEQYHVFHSKSFQTHARSAIQKLPGEIAALTQKIAAAPAGEAPKLTRERRAKQQELQLLTQVLSKYTAEAYAKLTERERQLHQKAFCTNEGDPGYRDLTSLRYRDGGAERTLEVPQGDVLHQFRQDVAAGKLPAVSWVVPPERFSDHPGSPWYGAWMLSEVLNILTQNPEVWRKTIFVLTYDENDGYFDHVPPFAVPAPGQPESGRTSEGIDPSVEFWPLDRDRQRKPAAEARGGPVGLGFRVPLVVASPWSRGGHVCSEVFDHTSVLQLLESVLTHKTGKPIRETNISAWRRSICGDLSSVFQPASPSVAAKLSHPSRNAVIEGIHKAQFKELPSGYRRLSAAEVEQASRDPRSASWLPRQEAGVRPSLPLPYQLYASAGLSTDRKSLEIVLEAGRELLGSRSAGSPFHVYTPGKFRGRLDLRTRAYAVEAGRQVRDSWLLDGFESGYQLRCHGPNGFFREWNGDGLDPLLDIRCEYVRDAANRPTGNLELVVTNRDSKQAHAIEVVDRSYGRPARSLVVPPGRKQTILLDLSSSSGWYDCWLTVQGAQSFTRHFAGHVETGKMSVSDPAMGRRA
jgi:phospholipase C